MKKLHLITLILCLFGSLYAQAQPSKKGMQQRAATHNAKFMVYDFTTRQPIQHAVVSSQKGYELGQTNADGIISISVPSNPMEFYSISAEGYNKMTLRLTDADKKNGKYEVFLPSVELGYDHVSATVSEKPMVEPEGEKVKIYVKQDPATYQKKTTQGGEILFSVQVAASSNPVSETVAKKEWSDIGQVYIHQENGMYKVRIGPFESQLEAKQVLLDVKEKGRKDAFIVVQQDGGLDIPVSKPAVKVIEAPVVTPPMEPTPTESIVEYKVRVASYLHPGTFNPDGIDQLGTLESYRKGEWTIMMIGGFKSIDEAKRAKEIVMSKGFNDAAIVVDKDAIIETILE